MEIQLINEQTGENIELIEIEDSLWETLEAHAELLSKTPEDYFRELIMSYARRAMDDAEEALNEPEEEADGDQ
jgi:hypothetical protein